MDGRPPGNTGCCRLFFFFWPPLSFSARPPPPQAPPAAGPSHPTALRAVACLPAPRGVGGRGPDSRCRPGLPPRGPRAPPHSASRKPEDRRGRGVEGVLSVWGSLGRPQALPGGAPAPAPAPAPPPDASSQAASGSPAGVRTTHSHNHSTHSHTHTTLTLTHTHTHTHPPPRKVKSRRPQVRETEKEGERDRQQEDHTDFQSPGRHTLPPPFWVPPGPQSTRPPPSPTDTLTHTLSRAQPLAWGRGLGLALGGQAEGDL